MVGMVPNSFADVTSWVGDNPLLLLILAVPVLLIIGRVASNASRQKDPQRMYTSAQRRDGFARAEGRCELDGFLWFRCRESAAHGDHHLPWSKGGATSMQNFVAACARCNTSKGAKMPSFFQTRRIQARRRGYFPAGLSLDAGEWFGR